MGKFLKTYKSEIIKSMKYLGSKNNTVFLGQSVAVPGNLIYGSLCKVPQKKKIELPVFEDTQMGMSIGLSLNGYLPITCYPRFDFFILSLNQTINHLDKLNVISSKEFDPFVIIRVLVGAKKPVDAGLQHTQNYSKELKSMAKYLNVIELKDKETIFKEYKKCFKKKKSTLFVEYTSKY
jgi:pyruvate/2-oxoglutarate/acetoin dehydrogenase E1 component